ncbi:MAG: hypothetical protein GXY65_01505 [Rhodococcus sp.]|uniref:hypothetical protein n=1 Tax=Rhodococcus TaxID=1827 RepID=UPI0016B3B016|nr:MULTISPECIES: hypothetical protein [Rhodococcus]NLV78020.1 hypothetical protein [Rhodococcus sp. (in: high G+C Gram-positive bacteria)]
MKPDSLRRRQRLARRPVQDFGDSGMAFNRTRAAATLTGDPKLVKATTGTVRRKLSAVRADVLVDVLGRLAADVEAVGEGPVPVERAAFDDMAERARWHRERVAYDD